MVKKKKLVELSIRQLTVKDAYRYYKIASAEDLGEFMFFFSADSIEVAKKKISQSNNRYEKLFGLFTKANRLVAVFDVNDDVGDFGATVNYFVAKQFRGNHYATIGIQMLYDMLDYTHFTFEVHKANHYSLAVQKQLGSTIHHLEKDYIVFSYSNSI